MRNILLSLGIVSFFSNGFCTNSGDLGKEAIYAEAIDHLDSAMETLGNLHDQEMYFNGKLTDQIQMLTRSMLEENIYYKAMTNKNPTVDVMKECLNFLKTQLKNKSITDVKAGEINRLMLEFMDINRLESPYYRKTEESLEEIQARKEKAEELREKVLKKNGKFKKSISEDNSRDYFIEAIELGCGDIANSLIDKYGLPVEFNVSGLNCNAVIYAAAWGRLNVLKHFLKSKEPGIKKSRKKRYAYSIPFACGGGRT